MHLKWISLFALLAHVLIVPQSYAQTVTDDSAETFGERITATHSLLTDSFKDPDSAKYRKLMISGDNRIVCGQVNAKNGFGAYSGYNWFWVDLVQNKYDFESEDALASIQFKASFGLTPCGEGKTSPFANDFSVVNLDGGISGFGKLCETPAAALVGSASGYAPVPFCEAAPEVGLERIKVMRADSLLIEVLHREKIYYTTSNSVWLNCNGTDISMDSWLLRSIPDGVKPCW